MTIVSTTAQKPSRTKLEQVLDQMEQSAFEFHLTGSRGICALAQREEYKPKPDTDWDFFTPPATGTDEFLTSLGFTLIFDREATGPIDSHPYGSADCARVYRWVEPSLVKEFCDCSMCSGSDHEENKLYKIQNHVGMHIDVQLLRSEWAFDVKKQANELLTENFTQFYLMDKNQRRLVWGLMMTMGGIE